MTDLLFAVAAAVSQGATLYTSTHRVGPIRGVDGQWGCFRHDGMPVVAWEEWDEAHSPHIYDRRGNLAVFIPQHRRDYSAFAAARAFLSQVGSDAAFAALRRLEQRKVGAREVEVIRLRRSP